MRKKQVTHTLEFETAPTDDPNAVILYARWEGLEAHSYGIMRPSEIAIAIEHAERPEDIVLFSTFRTVLPQMLERAQKYGIEPGIMAFLADAGLPSLDWGDGIPENRCLVSVDRKQFSVRYPDDYPAVTAYSFPVSPSGELRERLQDYLSASEVSARFSQLNVPGPFSLMCPGRSL